MFRLMLFKSHFAEEVENAREQGRRGWIGFQESASVLTGILSRDVARSAGSLVISAAL